MTLSLSKDSVVRITGPAKVEVKKGKILLVGAVYEPNSSIIIHRLRSYGLKALEDSELSVTLGTGATVEEPSEGEEVVDEWLRICEVLEKDMGKLSRLTVMILGPIESGKTTLTAFISNYFIQKGKKVGLIDADIGQEDVAIPTTIALAEPKDVFVWQRDLSPKMIKFVGCISPQYCQNNVMAALMNLLNEVKDLYEVLIINTDGWVTTPQALEFKLSLIRWLKPTHVLVLNTDLATYIQRSLPKNVKVLNTPRPAKVKERSREERRRLRAEAYRKYFSNAKERDIDLNDVKIFGSCLLSGKELSIDEVKNLIRIPEELINKIAYVSKYYNIINIFIEAETIPYLPRIESQQGLEVNILKPQDQEGIVVGILDNTLRDVAVGIIKKIDLRKKSIRILTPWEGPIGALVVGRVKVSLDTFEDTSRLGKCVI